MNKNLFYFYKQYIFIILTIFFVSKVYCYEKYNNLDLYTKKLCKKYNIPFFSAIIKSNDLSKMDISVQCSLVEKEKLINENKKNMFEFGSVMKYYTALITLYLLDIHNLKLDTKINEIVARFNNQYAKKLNTVLKLYPQIKSIRIVDLLRHESLLFDEQQTNSYYKSVYRHRYKPITLYEHILNSFKNGQYKENTKFHYANVNYILLGLLDEIIGNHSFKKLFNEIIKPSNGLIYYSKNEEKEPYCKNLLPGYTLTTPTNLAIFDDIKIKKFKIKNIGHMNITCKYSGTLDDGPAGGLLGTLNSLLNSFHFLIKNHFYKKYNDIIFSKKQLIKIKSNINTVNNLITNINPKFKYGLGVWSDNKNTSYQIWRLIGEQWGYMSGILYIPKQKKLLSPMIVVYATNIEVTNMSLFINEFINGLIKKAATKGR